MLKLRLIGTLMLTALFTFQAAHAQSLKLKTRKPTALNGGDFAKNISDSSLTLANREEIIFNEIKKGNVPDFLRKLKTINDTVTLKSGNKMYVSYQVLPDYFAIGNNANFLYIPMTPILAQRVANLLNCSLPTKKMVNEIYKNAGIKLAPKPIPPTKAMTTVPIFIAHTDSVRIQLQPLLTQHNEGQLTAGNKKDIIISNKIYTEQTPKVVIYGWHQLNGKAIQPVYNKHTNLWADYSHGIRLIQNKITVNGKKTTIAKILKDPELCVLLSDEGVIKQPFYPITAYQPN